MGTLMTSKQRLLAAIRFQGPDRVPVSPRIWRYLLKHEGTQRHEAYLKYAQVYRLDPLLALPAGHSHMLPGPGSDYALMGPEIRVDEQCEARGDLTVVRRTFETPAGRLTDEVHVPKPGGEYGIAPNDLIKEYPVKGPEDLPALERLVTAWTGAATAPDYRARAAEIGGRALLCASVQSALSHNAGDAYPLMDMMVDMRLRPKFVHDLIDVFHRPLMDATRRAIDGGAEMVYCSTFFESMSMGWSPAMHREFFLPRIKAHVDLVHSGGALYHLYDDGKVALTLGTYCRIGVDMFSTVCPPPSGDVTPGEAREIAGTRTCLNGGIDTVNAIWRGTPETIDAAVRDAIREAALPEGGYILGTSDSITEETPPENFRAFFDAADRWGTPPAQGGS